MASIDFEGIKNNQYTRYPNNMININGHYYLIQCPDNIDENTTFYVAGRGSGGIGDTYSTLSAAKNKNVIVIAPVKQGEGDFPGAVDVIGALSQEFGIEPHASFSGHSNSGPLALQTAEKYIDTYHTPTTIVLNDPYNHGNYKVDYSKFDGSVILNYGPRGGGCTEGFMPKLQKAAAAGAKVIICRYNGDHGAADEVAAAMGAYDIGNLTLIDNGSYVTSGGATVNSKYTYQWMDENGKLHDFADAAEAQAYLNEALIGINKSLYEQCSNLADFAARFQGGGDTLASNLVVVSNSMNELKGKITEHQDLNYTKESDNEASIIGAMYTATNYYGTVTNLLYGNISAEADAVYGIANAIYQMDGFASVMADSTLSDGMSSLYSTSNPAVAEQLNKLKAASAGLLDTARSAVMANGRYDELTNILGTKAEAGHVGKISISSLESAINSIVPVLNNEVEVATGLNASVTDFMSNIGASNVLQGGVWEDVKTNMANYQNLLDANVKASEFLTDTVKTAMGIVTDYIQGAGSKISAVGALADYGNLATVGELDDSKLPELTAALTEMQTKIDETDAKVKELEASRHMVDDGYTDEKTGEFVKTGEHQEPPESEIQPYRDQLENYKQIKETLDAYREVLEGFAPVVQAAQDIINDAVNQVKNMYENPVQDTDGNITFNTDFKLDLSPYSDYIDVAKDYKGLINDYYDKLNPKTPEVDPDTENPDGDDPAGSGDPDDDGYDGGGGGGGGGGPISGPDTPTVPTDPKTEPKTEPLTEPKTESKTEPKTEAKTEVQTETSTEVATQTEPKTEPTASGGSHVTPSGKTNTKLLSTEEEPIIQDTQETILDPVVEEPMIDEYMEQPFIKPEDVPQEIVANPSVVKNKDKSLKTMGIAGGIGVLLGSAALGAHTILKNKEDEESTDDYGYDK